MTGPAAAALAAGLELADMHRHATHELDSHWPDSLGICIGCGDAYPCAEEWITMRAISAIESCWRHESRQLVAAQTPAVEVAAGDEEEPGT